MCRHEREKVTPRRLLTHSAGLTVWGFPGYALDSLIPTVQQLLDGVPPANTVAVNASTWKYGIRTTQNQTRLWNRTQAVKFLAAPPATDRFSVRFVGLLKTMLFTVTPTIFVAMLLVQRNTERAVMRALGLARRRLRSIVLGEAAIVATASVVVGTIIGVPMAYMFVQILRRIFVVPPTLSSPDSLPLLLLGLLQQQR